MAMKSGLGIAAFASAMIVSAGAHAVTFPITNQDTSNYSQSNLFLESSPSNNFAQQFIVGTTGTLSQLYLYTGDNYNLADSVSVKIYKGSDAGAITVSNLLGTYSVLATRTATDWYAATGAPPLNISVTAGESLMLVVHNNVSAMFYESTGANSPNVGDFYSQSCNILTGCGAWADNGENHQLLFVTAVTPTPTPLPAALPLFAGGLGLMGVLGWRRKRKAA